MTTFGIKAAVKHGETVGFKLLQATEKEAWLADTKRQLMAELEAGDIDRVIVLAEEFKRLKAKRDSRNAEVNAFIGKDMVVRVVNLGDESTVAQGKLIIVNSKKARVTVQSDENRIATVDYATPLPVPESLNQAYFGHQLIVGFGVLSIADGKEWVLK